MLERAASLRLAEERLRLVEERLGVGSWSWERASGEMKWSPGLYRLLGLDASSVTASPSFYESLVHPKDRLAFGEPIGLATDDRQRNRRFRIIRPDGGLRWLWSLAHTVFDRSGGLDRVVAAVCDVTELEETRRRLVSDRGLIETVSKILQIQFWKADVGGQLLEVSGWRSKPGGVLQSDPSPNWRATIHPDDRDQLAETWRAAAAGSHRYEFSPRVRMADGQYRKVHVVGLPFDAAFADEPLWGGLATLDSRVANLAAPDRRLGPDVLSAAQIRAARAYLGWSAEELASLAKVSVSTVRRVEGSTSKRAQAASVKQIQGAFETAGLMFWRDQAGRFCIAGV